MDTDAGVVASLEDLARGRARAGIENPSNAKGARDAKGTQSLETEKPGVCAEAQRRGGGLFGFLEGPASTRAGIGIGTRTPWKAFLQKAEMRNSDP